MKYKLICLHGQVLSVVALVLWSACIFDTSGSQLPGGNDSDAGTPSADACIPGCSSDVLTTCDPAPDVQTCDFGCNAAELACVSLQSSNLDDDSFLAGNLETLVFPANSTVAINTDSGQILVDSAERRPAGGGVREGVYFDDGNADIGVFGVAGLDVGGLALVQVIGSRPLLVASSGDILVEGQIDASAGCEDGSNRCGGPGGGTGSDIGIDEGGQSEPVAATGCAPGSNGTGSSGGPLETGGGGGGFGAAGGNGGDGDGDDPGGLGGDGPATCTGVDLIPLTGGSGAGAGGEGTDGGIGGGGGGAVQLSSHTSVRIIGQPTNSFVGIQVNGTGGMGGEAGDGGGGGGSGGAILLEAPEVVLNDAILSANGGGGGGGGNQTENNRGADGTFGVTQAPGGASGGQAGGLGGSLLGAATDGAGGGDDTGGGGGSVGIIRINVRDGQLQQSGTVLISPAHTEGAVVLE